MKPQAYMNRSGPPVQKLASYFKIQVSDIIVVHDDLDLDFGRLRIAENRGHGGHNGIRSIVETLGTKAFVRIKVGIGRPQGQRDVTGHVLGRFSTEENGMLDTVLSRSAEACVAVMEQGVTSAMNTCNTRG
jgi:PTH1 family peptidyl-tRNA hydrolase